MLDMIKNDITKTELRVLICCEYFDENDKPTHSDKLLVDIDRESPSRARVNYLTEVSLF
jgi:hypothetical protein